jgi:hypothetical protein
VGSTCVRTRTENNGTPKVTACARAAAARCRGALGCLRLRAHGTRLVTYRGADGARCVGVRRQRLVPAQLGERVGAAPRCRAAAPRRAAVAEDALEAGVAHRVTRAAARLRGGSAPAVTNA